MDTSELLRTPTSVFLIALTFGLAFLAAYRISENRLRVAVRIVCSIGAFLSSALFAFMVFARGEPIETFTEVRNGPFKVIVRSQEFHHSGIINLDVCVSESSSPAFPGDKKPQCFLHGYDFSGLSVKWLSQRDVEIAFNCGRVTTFTNSASMLPHGPTFNATLRDECAKRVP